MSEKGRRKKRPLRLKRANPTHAMLLVIVGGYLIYMAIQMLKNTQSGQSSMSMTTTAVLMLVMILAGAAVWVYAGYLFYVFKTAGPESDEEAAGEEATSDHDLAGAGPLLEEDTEADEQ